MGLITRGKIDKLRGVVDRAGELRPAATADLQEAISERLGLANDKLGNADAVFSDKIEPSTAGETLPAHPVDEGSEVLLMADPANSGPIYVGPPGGETVPIPKGKGATFGVSSTDALAAKASSSGDVLHIVAEGGA